MKTILLVDGCDCGVKEFESIIKGNFEYSTLDFSGMEVCSEEMRYFHAESSIDLFNGLDALNVLIIKNCSDKSLLKAIEDDFFAFEVEIVDKMGVLSNTAFCLNWKSEDFEKEAVELITKLAF